MREIERKKDRESSCMQSNSESFPSGIFLASETYWMWIKWNSNYNCITSCRILIVQSYQFQYMIGWMIAVLAIIAIISYVIRRFSNYCCSTIANHHSYDISHCSCNLLKFLSNIKSIIRPKNRYFWHHPGSNYKRSLRLTANDIVVAKQHFAGIPQKVTIIRFIAWYNFSS